MDKDICDLAQCLQDLRKISALWQSDIQCECGIVSGVFV